MITSPPPSPITMPLTLPAVASILVKLRRTREKPRADWLECSSGDPQTHPCVANGTTSTQRISLKHSDLFICKGAVDLPKLLRVSRASLFETAVLSGADVLLDERWHCEIRAPKDTIHHPYKVRIRYFADASRSSRRDPQKPVALDRVRNVPGLMTVLQREEVTP